MDKVEGERVDEVLNQIELCARAADIKERRVRELSDFAESQRESVFP